MATGVLLSIDTELTWRAHRAGYDWRENLRRSYDAAGVGIGYQLDMLARHRLAGCFFVDPMPALLFGIEPVRRMIDPILAAGQEVQLHLHPMWLDADRRRGERIVHQDMTGRPLADQRAIVDTALALLREAGAPDPVAFRAGNFGADDATIAAVAAAGLRYDSSHDGCMVPYPCATGLPTRAVAPLPAGGIVELPMMLIEAAGGELRHLQIGAVSYAEMRAALRHAEREGNPLVTILGHGFELATRDGLRANRIVRRRFDRLCAYLDAERARFPTVRLDTLDDLPLGIAATPARTGAALRWGRLAIQAASNLAYERRL